VTARAWIRAFVWLALLAACCASAQTARAGGVLIRRIDTRDYPTINMLVVTPRVTGDETKITENSAPVAGFAAQTSPVRKVSRWWSTTRSRCTAQHSRTRCGRPMAS
jgi:hypothetical protein